MNPSSHSILNSSTQNDHWDTTGWFVGVLAHLVGWLAAPLRWLGEDNSLLRVYLCRHG